MNRQNPFNKGALYALPMFFVLLVWVLYGDRFPGFSLWLLAAIAGALLLLIIAPGDVGSGPAHEGPSTTGWRVRPGVFAGG